MKNTSEWRWSLPTALLVLLLVGVGCERDSDDPAPQPSDSEVFLDGFGPDVTFYAFANSKLDALGIEYNDTYEGAQALKVSVPAEGDPSGWFAGGTFVTQGAGRDLSAYNALTFWAKASIPATVGVFGIGNDNTGTSRFTAEWGTVSVGTSWQKLVVPIPLAERLVDEKGLFHFAAGHMAGAGYTLWFDEVQFEELDNITNPRPTLPPVTIQGQVGDFVTPPGGSVTFAVDGVDQVLSCLPGYFTFSSSDTTVATVAADGRVEMVGAGTASLTATLGSVAAQGAITLQGFAGPADPAAAPTLPGAEVLSLFSNAYTNHAVDSWSADWDMADFADVQIDGDDVKLYTNVAYAGILFESSPVDASDYTHVHLDVYTLDPSLFKVKLVDFGADGVYNDPPGSGDDSESEISLTTTTNPAMQAGAWSSLDLPLAYFSGLDGTSHLTQLILSGSSSTLYVDNIYFFTGEAPTGPPVPAPAPVPAAADVVALFSDAYNPNHPVNTWSAVWDVATLVDTLIAGNATKHYTNMVYAGIEFTSPSVDATDMNRFHMDIWVPGPTAPPAQFGVKLVDWGANGVWGGGDDVEHTVWINSASTPPLQSETWVSCDIPLTSFTGMTTRAHISQMVIEGLPNVYVDNVYFWDDGTIVEPPTEPTEPAPTPSYYPENVISLFSNAYDNVPVNTWSTVWDIANVADVQIQGNDTKHYTGMVFAGIEFTSPTIDATGMTHFRLDYWTPDPTASPAVFRIKLVDFGANGVWSGGDDVEHELSFTSTSTPALVTGNWITFDIPLSQFTNLITRGHMAQLILSGSTPTAYIDNVLFHR